MSEKLEEKYKYMCKLAEDLTVKLHMASEKIMALEAEKLQLHIDLNTVEDSNVDVQVQITEIHRERELLKDYVDNMCGMIEAETPLKEHDRWLKDCRKMGWYPDNNTIDAEFEEEE
jgi:chromosome segregation ATPase